MDPAECMERLRFETLLTELSAGFIHLPADQVGAAIVDAQHRVCDCLGLDLAVLWQWEYETPGTFTLTHHFRRGDGPPISSQLQASELWPWSLREIQANRSVVISSTEDDVPEGAERDRESFRYFGVKSLLLIPLSTGGRAPFGAISFSDMATSRIWSETLVKRLELVAQMFANTIARKRTELALRESAERLNLAAESAGAGLWSLDLATGRYWTTEPAKATFGFSPDEDVTLDRVLEATLPEDRAVIRQAIDEVVATGGLGRVEYRIVRPDGSLRWLASRGRLHREPGRPSYVMGVTMDVTELKMAQESHKQSEFRLAAALDVAELGFYELHNGVRVSFLDRRAREILGASEADEQAGRILEFWWEHLHPEDRPGVMEVQREMEEAGRDRLTVDYRFLHPERGVIHIHHLVHVIERDAAGIAVRTIGVLQDVTERKQKEEELRAKQVHLASAIEAAGLGFYEMGADGRTHVADDRLRALIGISGEEGGSRVRDFWLAHVDPEDLPRVLQESRDLRSGAIDRVADEYRYRHPTRGELWLHHLARAIERDAAGHAARTVGVLQDVTERRRAEEAIRKSETRLALAIDTAELGLYEEIGPPDNRLTTSDERALRMVGAPLDHGGHLREFWIAHVHADDRPYVLDVVRSFDVEGQDLVAMEYRYWHGERGLVWLRHLVRAVARDGNGLVVRTVGVFQDITERKEAEMEARRAQNELAHAARLSVLGELAASMAHELNQPLAAILSNAQAARRFLAAPNTDLKEIREILDDIVRDDKRAGEVIHHMRAMVQKKDSVVAEPLDFNGLVRDTSKLVHSEMVVRDIGQELSLTPKLPAVLAGRIEMQQVLLNLMVNAMDAMRDQPADRRQLRIETFAAGGGVRVAVRDHGHGIPENVMADIFRPFFTTKTQGLGMGLSISRSIVEARGGKLWAENAPDGGAIFWIEMPAREEERGTGGEGRGARVEGENRRGEGA